MLRLVLITIALMTTSCSDASSNCNKEDTLKLIGAGFSKAEIAELCDKGEKSNGVAQSEPEPSIDELFSKFKELAGYESDSAIYTYEFDNCNFYHYEVKKGIFEGVVSKMYYNNLSHVDPDKKLSGISSGIAVGVVYPRGHYGISISPETMSGDFHGILSFLKRVKQPAIEATHEFYAKADDKLKRGNQKLTINGIKINLSYFRSQWAITVPDVYSADKSEILGAFEDLVKACAKRPATSQSKTSVKPKSSTTQPDDPSSASKRFSKDEATGIISDSKTGFEWMEGPEKDTNYHESEQFIATISDEGGGGWRMPTKDELMTLYQKGIDARNMVPIFPTIGLSVWAGSRDSSSAWIFNFRVGKDLYWLDRGFAESNRVVAVRSRPPSQSDIPKVSKSSPIPAADRSRALDTLYKSLNRTGATGDSKPSPSQATSTAKEKDRDGNAKVQLWHFFCTDEEVGELFKTCSRNIYSYEVPWAGRNLDHDTEGTEDSVAFSKILHEGDYEERADSYCRRLGFTRASDGWPLKDAMNSWHKSCKSRR